MKKKIFFEINSIDVKGFSCLVADAIVVFTPLSSFDCVDATASLRLERCPNINIKYTTMVHLQPLPEATVTNILKIHFWKKGVSKRGT